MSIYKEEGASIPLLQNYSENRACSRLYKGYHRFNKEQFYEGEFFRDSLHGQGAYTWKNIAVYEGGFYSNSKEGYASLSFPDNSHFEGLFVKNQPFGPGILTYANGRQDAGFWMGKKLIRLSRAVDYIIPRLAPTSAAKIKLLQFKRVLPLNEDFYDSATDIIEKFACEPINILPLYSSIIYDPRSIFFDKEIFDKAYFINHHIDEFIKDTKESEKGIRESVELFEEEEASESSKEVRVPSHCLCEQDVLKLNYDNEEETDICERESFKGELELGILGYFTKFGTIEKFEENEELEESQILQECSEEEKCPRILLWNRSELCREMLKQMFRYRGFEEKLNFNLAKLMLGVRTAFRRTGEKEKQCLQLLKMCSIGPPHAVKDLLCSYEISQDLMDGRGNNSLMFAAAADQHEIMEILLDYGVDANNFNDEGLTPLNLCLLRKLALTYKISNWETAFLPQEIDKSLFANNVAEEKFQAFQSIPSLDRIFGDGMSVHDSKTLVHDKEFLALLSTTSLHEESQHVVDIKSHNFFDNFEAFNLSQISLQDILRSPRDFSGTTAGTEETDKSLQKLSSFCSFRTVEPSQEIGSNDPTPKVNVKYVPKLVKREEFEKSIQKVNTDRYLFELTFKKNPNLEGSKKEKQTSSKPSKAKGNKAQEKEEEKNEEEYRETEEMDLDLIRKQKLAEIDKTIEKLLQRGADPNISEAPKPSIHLGLYTKDLKLICSLLMHGANPDSQLYPNEGLLTPLHVLVLQEPHEKNIQICEILLNFEANPELETSPEFFMSEEEKNLLDSERGRTPLQLLCMRPDLEYVDSNDILTTLAVLLANVSDNKHFHNGHSCLTLAMLSGNIKILKTLLEYRCFDPNDILGNDRGTALHVLVSTELQKITTYDNSIRMCDLLLAKGANPLKKFDHPEKLVGTCVDYGYREIEAEKEERKASAGKKDAKASNRKEITSGRDHLKDHERVVEYLSNVAADLAKYQDIDCNVKNKSKIPSRMYMQNTDTEDESETDYKDSRERDRNKKRRSLSESREKKEMFTGNTERIKDNMGLEKTKKETPVKLEVMEKKEKESKTREERSWKNERFSEDKSELKNQKKQKQKDTNEYYKKPKLTEKKETEKRDKRKTGTCSTEKTNTKNFQKAVGSKCQGAHSETFPEKLRQVFLQLYGTRYEIDINELLVPYVVLRNGELYYRFNKKSSSQKEQYSLI